MLEIEPFNGPEEIENIQLNNKAANANLKVLESLDEHINDLKSNANTRIDVLNNLVSLSELWHEYIKIHDYLKKGEDEIARTREKEILRSRQDILDSLKENDYHEYARIFLLDKVLRESQ